ncbi:LptF/LptG family permease [Kamptonema cortianum]|nr:LptF/LptG family permease [Geitlerinema splendidum]MDK3155877.1 LptF/LptG family permease [Kamptonema cortianum]
MKRLDRYLLKEMAVPVIAGTLITALLFMANEMIAVFKQLDLSHVPPMAVLKFLLLKMPFWLTLTIPTGMALGAALALSRLVRDGELTAMRAAGVSIARVLRMVWVVGFLMALVALGNEEKVFPRAAAEARKISSDLMIVASMPKFQRNLMLKLDRYTANFAEVEQTDEDGLRLTGILMIEQIKTGETGVFRAPRGHYYKGVWTIEDPKYMILKDDDATVIVRDADRIVINQRIELQDFMQGGPTEDASLQELAERIRAGVKAKANVNKLVVQYHEKLARPAACIVFALSSALLAVRFSRGSAFMGLMISFVSIWLYFNLHVIATNVVGVRGWLPPALATWMPVILYGSVAVILGRRLE